MATAREIMSGNAECAQASDTIADAARRLAELDVGALPICGDDGRLKGVITDRDIVVKVVARSGDAASTRVGDLAQGEAVTVGADDDAGTVLQTMREHKVRRLPVIDGHDLVGIIALADVARALPDTQVADLLEVLSTD
jgi:CBS domain-containing protein